MCRQWGCADFPLGVEMAEIFLSRAYLDHEILIEWYSLQLIVTNTHSYSLLKFPLEFLKLPVQLRNPCLWHANNSIG
jgi:hypothetical protein